MASSRTLTLFKKIQSHSLVPLIIISVALLTLSIFYYNATKDIPCRALHLVTKTAHESTDNILSLLTRQINYAHMLAAHPIISTILKDNDPEHQDYKQLRLFLEEVGTAENYYSSIVIDAHGLVRFSNFAPEYKGITIFESPHNTSSLSKTVQRSRMTATYDITDYTYDPIIKKPALLIVVPIFEQGALLGFIAQVINNNTLENLFNNYVFLGKTASISVGIASSNGILRINENSLNGVSAFKEFINAASVNLPLDEQLLFSAIHGNHNHKIMPNAAIPAALSWNFIPFVDWGMVITQPLKEFYEPYTWLLYTIFVLIGLLIVTCITLIWHQKLLAVSHQRLMQSLRQPFCRKILATVLLTLITAVFIFTLLFFIQDARSSLKRMKVDAQKITTDTTRALEATLNKVALVAESLAENLNTGMLHHADIVNRLQQDLKNSPEAYIITVAFEPYKFDKKKRLYAPYATRNGNETSVDYYEQTYDYTQSQSAVQTDRPWYTEPILTNKSVWFDPYKQVINNLTIFFGAYSVPFYDPDDYAHAHPIGVVNIAYNFDLIQEEVAQLVLGSTGFGILFSSGKTFAEPATLLSYPQNKYVVQSQTMFDLAQEEGNEKLFTITEDILAGSRGFYSYKKPHQKSSTWMYVATVPLTEWIIATIFSGSQARLPSLAIRHYCTALLVILMLFTICAFWCFSKHFWDVRYLAKILTFTLINGLLILLIIIRLTPKFTLPKDLVPITDQTHINTYTIEQQLYAKNINEPLPKVLPFGLSISSINFPDPTTLDITGYLWQSITDPQDKQLLEKLQFVQAIEPVQFKEIYEFTHNQTTLICWRFFAHLSQELNLTQYPLDTITIQVQLEHPDFGKNFILVPLIETYNKYYHNNLPALAKDITLSGFNIHNAYFAFEEKKPIPFGLDTINMPYRLQTAYEVTLTRNLLYDFIVYILPLLIIYILLYTITILSNVAHRSKNLYTLSAYTGLIFVAILLHRILRQQYLAANTLYIEYIFFLLYISFIINVLYLSFDISGAKSGRLATLFSWFIRFFWPLQLSALFIITILSFMH